MYLARLLSFYPLSFLCLSVFSSSIFVPSSLLFLFFLISLIFVPSLVQLTGHYVYSLRITEVLFRCSSCIISVQALKARASRNQQTFLERKLWQNPFLCLYERVIYAPKKNRWNLQRKTDTERPRK